MTKTVWNSGTFLSSLSEWQIESSKEQHLFEMQIL